jgi:3-deoxy-D-manno-octulosonic-acid transferase
MFLVYSLLFTVGVILTAPYYLWRLRGRILSGAGWRDRFGFLPPAIGTCEIATHPHSSGSHASSSCDSTTIWIHAVSVGETLAVAGLVEELHRRYPQLRIFMSQVTPAAREVAEKRLPSAKRPAGDQPPGTGSIPDGLRSSSGKAVVAGRFFLPLDWNWCVRRVLKRIRPALLLIVETELWPNLLKAANRLATRVVLVNARLSDRSLRGYRRFGFFMRRVLANVDLICAQTARDAERFRQLGVPAERIIVTGNMKFDGVPPPSGALAGMLTRSLQAAGRGPVVVAASTMPGEEELVLSAWAGIRSQWPQALLILAPRHPARFPEVRGLLRGKGLSYVCRTDLPPADEAAATTAGLNAAGDGDNVLGQIMAPEVLLLDTIGELAGIFELADIVFIGGSLVPTGGHNLLEPAFWAKPILFGRHMDNFRDIAHMFLEARAAVQVEDAKQLAEEACQLLSKPELSQEMGKKGREILERESGARQRIMDQLERLLTE